MCQLTNFGVSNEETESKIEIYAKKLSKIGPVGNFDFWSKVNAKSQSQSQLVQGQSQRILVRVSSGFSGRVIGQAVEPMTSSYDVSLTWTRADMDVLAWLLTWSDNVIR